MLEIIAIIWLGRHLNSTAKIKGHSGLWGVLGPAMWIGFEFTGAFIAVCAGASDLGMYGMALVSALVGGGLSIAIVNALPNRMLDDDFDVAPEARRDPEAMKANPFA